jgi:hypothetical protein
MMACQHFLAGRCNRSDADCKWSHGAVARLAELLPWQVRSECAVPRTILSLTSVERLLYRPPIFHHYWGSGSGSTCFDGPPESRSISQSYGSGSGSISQEVRIRIRTKMGILNTGFHSLFTEKFFRLYCSEQPAIQCSGSASNRCRSESGFESFPFLCLSRAGIFKQSMGDRNAVGIGLSYRPARLHRLAESFSWNRFLGSINV